MLDPFDALGPVFTPDPVVRSHPLNHGKVAWWLTLPGLDGGKSWYDLMGLNPGTLTNLTTSTSGWRGTTRPGGWGHLLFDGTDDRVTAANAPAIQSLSRYTIAAWVRPDSASFSSAIAYFFAKFPNRGFGIDGTLTSTHKLLCFDNQNVRLGNTALVAGTWYRAAFAYDGTNVNFYLNGTADGTGAQTAPTDATVGISLGGRNDGLLFYAGAMDDVGYWNRCLSAAEVQADYDLSRVGYPGVLRRWPGMGPGLMVPTGGGAWWLVGGGTGNPLVGGGLVH